MIAKIRRGSFFKGLHDYLMSEARGLTDDDVELRNLVSLETAAAEMRIVAVRSKRVEQPVYHLIVAWHEDEKPTRDDMFAIGHELLERINLAAHQALLCRHPEAKAGLVPGSGRHFELHLMVNRVGPDGRAAAMRNDYAIIERAVADIARTRSMRVVPGRFNGIEGHVQGSSEAARSLESATGRLSPAMELRADPVAMADLAQARAQGWPALAAAFARRGFRLVESNRTGRAGQSAGLVLVDGTDEKSREKISALDTPDLKWGRPTLERELGPFVADLASTLQPLAVSREPIRETERSKAQADRQAFAQERDRALMARSQLGRDHAEVKRRLRAKFKLERKSLISVATRRRTLVRRFFRPKFHDGSGSQP